jgi:pantoate--beta-alanine ligase
MGAFHQGHLDLMRRARSENERVVVSLFVNPSQFSEGEDYSLYPRDEERDAHLAEMHGVDVLFAPDRSEMYRNPETKITVARISETYEGAHRPGHFDGVATVVCKLFNIVRPTRSYFGLKDLQQCAVVRRMVVDLNLPIELVLCETTREPDGLAMSSRNMYLSKEQRERAPILYHELSRCRGAILAAEAPEIEHELSSSRAALEASGFDLDYFDLVDPTMLVPKRNTLAPASLIAAARIGITRLIDNLAL